MPRLQLLRGEIVSCGYAVGTVITGRVVELRRRRDQKPFLMVEITSGRRQGQRDWPDEAWQLGVGPLEGACEMCTRPFRFQPGEDGHACASCLREETQEAHRRSQDPERRPTSWERKHGRDWSREQSS